MMVLNTKNRTFFGDLELDANFHHETISGTRDRTRTWVWPLNIKGLWNSSMLIVLTDFTCARVHEVSMGSIWLELEVTSNICVFIFPFYLNKTSYGQKHVINPLERLSTFRCENRASGIWSEGRPFECSMKWRHFESETIRKVEGCISWPSIYFGRRLF